MQNQQTPKEKEDRKPSLDEIKAFRVFRNGNLIAEWSKEKGLKEFNQPKK